VGGTGCSSWCSSCEGWLAKDDEGDHAGSSPSRCWVKPKDAGARADAHRQQWGVMQVGEAYMLYVVGELVLVAVEAGQVGMGRGIWHMN
jgi:hypothetical protein